MLQHLAEMADGHAHVSHSLSNEDYHAGPGISSSGLKEVLKSPAHYLAFLNRKREQTASQRFGELVHLALFEQSKFKGNVVIAPDVRKDSKAWKEFEKENEGKLFIKPDEAEAISGMISSILNHKIAAGLFTGGHPEVSVFANCPDTKILRKVRPDYLRDDDIIVDLKTTKDASLRSFENDSAKFKYHLSGAYYLDTVNLVPNIVKKKHFIIVAVEKDPPYPVMVYSLHVDTMDKGRALYQSALKKYSNSLSLGKWPGYSEEIVPLNLPMWASLEA